MQYLPLEKTLENMCTCQLCGMKAKNKRGILPHIRMIHKIKYKEYYEKFYKQPHEGICKICNKLTKYDAHIGGYRTYCSLQCLNNDPNNLIKANKTLFNRYGVNYPLQHNICQEHWKTTNIKKYGVENPLSLPEIINKREKTMLKRYGVVNANQSSFLRDRSIKLAKQSKPYRLPSNKIIYKMGYEPQFLDYIFKNKILQESEIVYYPKGIGYITSDNIHHYYFPDFYIPKWNLIVEIKSDFTESKDGNLILKETATKINGFNYIRIKNRPTNKLLDFTNFQTLFVTNS